MTIQQPDPLDELLEPFHLSTESDVCSYIVGLGECNCEVKKAKAKINALMIPRKEVEAALKDEKEQYCCNDPECSDFWLGNDIMVRNNAKADIRSALNIRPEGNNQ